MKDNDVVTPEVGGKVNHPANLEAPLDITIGAQEYVDKCTELRLREIMGEPMCNVGDESWVERMDRERETRAAVLWAMDCQAYAGVAQPRLKPTQPLILISTPQSVRSQFERMYRDAQDHGAAYGKMYFDPAAPNADRSVTLEVYGRTQVERTEPFVTFVHSELTLEDLQATAKVMDEAQANAPSLEEIRRVVAEVESLAPPRSEFVELPLNPQMAEIIGWPSVEVKRDLYERLVRGPFDASAEL